MRHVLRSSLGRSLGALGAEDRLSAAWTVACGRAMAERGVIADYTDGVVRVEVEDATWLQQMLGMRSQLAMELGRISGLRVTAVSFGLAGERRGPEGR